MSKKNDLVIESMLNQTEHARRCLLPSSKELNRLLRRRTANGELVQPASLMYVRSATWSKLSRREQAVWIHRTRSFEHPQEIFCLYSAAAMYGLSVANSSLRKICLAGSSNYFGYKDLLKRASFEHLLEAYGVPRV